MKTLPGIILSLCLPLVTGVAAAAEEAAAKKVPQIIDQSSIIDTAVGLVIVLLMIIGLAWLAKRYMQLPNMSKGQIQILGGVSLGAREKAVLISVEGERILLGVSPGRVQTLHVLSREAGLVTGEVNQEGDEETPEESFAEQLSEQLEGEQREN